MEICSDAAGYTGVVTKPTLLILSFSPLYRDARVLKQVELFKDRYRVITCAYGPAPDGVVKHVVIPDDKSQTTLHGRLITLRMYKTAYWKIPAMAWAREALRGIDVDAVLANDFESVPVALSLKPRFGVHADLHEYSPSQFEHNLEWKRRIAPFREWVIRKYVRKASSWTTTSWGFADKYREVFGFECQVVTNAAPYADLLPHQVGDPVRLVHHGGAAPARQIDKMLKAAMDSDANFIFDLYLQSGVGLRFQEIMDLSHQDPRITVHPAVPYRELVPLLNTYDVGVNFLPPTSFNHRYSLPNKILEFTQARLGSITAPSPEVARIVREYKLGVVTEDFSWGSLTEAIDCLKAKEIVKWKHAAHKAARELSSEQQNGGWERPIEALMRKGAL